MPKSRLSSKQRRVLILSVIACWLLFFLTLACSRQAAPTPNIEATVEAKVQVPLGTTPEPVPTETPEPKTRTPKPLDETSATPTTGLLPTPNPMPTMNPTPESEEGVTVAEYAAWCAGEKEKAPNWDELEETNQQVIDAIEDSLEKGRDVDPPAELKAYHRARLDVSKAVVSSLSLEPPDEIFSPFSIFAVALMLGQHIEEAEGDLSPSTRAVLLDAGCIEDDPPEPTPTPTPTLVPTPTPIEPGFGPNNPVESGEVLEGSDGTRIVVIGTNHNAWLLIKAENTSAFMPPTPPKEGHRFLLVSLQIANASGAGSVTVSASDFGILDDSLVLIETGCGSYWNPIPNQLQGEVFVGGKVTGNICFEVRQNASDFILIHEPGYASESRRFLKLD